MSPLVGSTATYGGLVELAGRRAAGSPPVQTVVQNWKAESPLITPKPNAPWKFPSELKTSTRDVVAIRDVDVSGPGRPLFRSRMDRPGPPGHRREDGCVAADGAVLEFVGTVLGAPAPGPDEGAVCVELLDALFRTAVEHVDVTRSAPEPAPVSFTVSARAKLN